MTSRAHVLVVEDEVDVAQLIKHTLERGGDVDVGIALTAEAALTKATEEPPDVIVLDLNLPGFDGLELCRILRSRPASASVPIIMVTARTTESDRIRGLEMGADDYVTKPFSPRELAARVRTALRRSRAQATPAHLVYRGRRLVADFDAIAVSVDGAPVRLTRREFELLRYLIQNRNRVVSRDRLLERVWGYDHAIDTRSVDVHIGRLRGKLGPCAAQIETIIGLGYRFVDDGGAGKASANA
ncbi:MAG: response regulator transcription factor [Acidobacteria bacterium]|nr:response regulator transcription factor [Acidobacteriota bacterium]